MPPRKCSNAGGRTPGQRTRDPPEQTAQRRALATTKIGAENDRDRDTRGRDRDGVDVLSSLPGQRMPQPPTLGLQRRERTPHLVLRAGADPTALGEREPVASAEAESDRREEQQPRERHSPRGPDNQREHDRGDAPRRRPAGAENTPVLLSARVIQPASSLAGGSAGGSAG